MDVLVGVFDGVVVGIGVRLGVRVGVGLSVGVGVAVSLTIGVAAGVDVGVVVGVEDGATVKRAAGNAVAVVALGAGSQATSPKKNRMSRISQMRRFRCFCFIQFS